MVAPREERLEGGEVAVEGGRGGVAVADPQVPLELDSGHLVDGDLGAEVGNQSVQGPSVHPAGGGREVRRGQKLCRRTIEPTPHPDARSDRHDVGHGSPSPIDDDCRDSPGSRASWTPLGLSTTVPRWARGTTIPGVHLAQQRGIEAAPWALQSLPQRTGARKAQCQIDPQNLHTVADRRVRWGDRSSIGEGAMDQRGAHGLWCIVPIMHVGLPGRGA